MDGESETIPKIIVLFYMTGMTSSTHSTWGGGPRRYIFHIEGGRIVLHRRAWMQSGFDCWEGRTASSPLKFS